jgi:hypothetical protein
MLRKSGSFWGDLGWRNRSRGHNDMGAGTAFISSWTILRPRVARLRAAGVQFRNDIVTGPGGSQILLKDPSGNLVELFQPARR